MCPTNTTNYDFNLPLVDDPTDEDLWGDYLNDNWTSIDALLLTASNNVTRAVSSTPISTSATDRNKVILADATAASITINLLSAATAETGFTVAVKKIDSTANTVTLDANGSDEIDGAGTYVLSGEGDSVVITTDGTDWFVVADKVPTVLSPKGSQAFTATGTFTTPATTLSTTQFKFTVTGAGGAGGGCTTTGQYGAGGGAGGTAIYYVTGLTPSLACAVTIGAAGAGGTGNGGAGGNTTVVVSATTITGAGGAGGEGNSSQSLGGTGGTSTNGTVNLIGGDGANGGTNSFSATAGNGGASFWGGGGGGKNGAANAAGNAGKAYGSGGGGAAQPTAGTSNGGDGKAGIVLVEWM